MPTKIPIYIEQGSKKAFAAALEWPGWCRGGKDSDGAIGSLLEYGDRYSAVMKRAAIKFTSPKGTSAFDVSEKLKGDASTDYGVPGVAPRWDARKIDDKELRRLIKVLQGCWEYFDHTADSAGGKALRLGPRGGGRDVEGMKTHVAEGQHGYLLALAGKVEGLRERDLRGVFTEMLYARQAGELPDKGPRGGKRWSAPYAIRRSAWHALDHAWEIEDRLT